MARPLQKERENRSAEKKDLLFHPYNVTTETAHTAVLLLESQEPELLCTTLRALTKFAGQDMSNRYVLFDLGAITYILPHIEHEEINIKRFALKALAQLCQLPLGPEQTLSDPHTLKKVCSLLSGNEDIFVLEFSSLVLAELTKEPIGCEQLISASILGVLFYRMKTSVDPDVQKNCLQIFLNIIEDPVTVNEVTKNPLFQWPPILALIQSPYIEIQQTALKTIDTLLGRYNDTYVQKSFKASTGIHDLCDMLEAFQYRDLHEIVLGVMRTYVETEENAVHVFQAGCVNKLLTYLDLAQPNMKPHCLHVLTRMSYTVNGRLALFETGTDLVFCHHLVSTNSELLADAAMGIANMCKMMPSAVRMADTNIVEAISGILMDENMPWFDIRINNLLAMSVFCRIIEKAAEAAADPRVFNALRNIGKKGKEAPIETQRLVCQTYLNLLNYQVSTRAMMNAEFISELIGTLQKPDVQLKIITANVLTGLMSEDVAGKTYFTSKHGASTIGSNLSNEHVGLRTALCHLITASITDENADVYLGILQTMIENKKARYSIPAWEVAIEAILSHHPSAKLAYTGRLDITDFTNDGFYVLKKISKPFPTMKELLISPPRRNTVLVAIFRPPRGGGGVSGAGDPSSANLESKGSFVSPASRQKLQPTTLPDDGNLREYISKLQIWLAERSDSRDYYDYKSSGDQDVYRTRCTEVTSSLKRRAQLLGEFVAEQMCGLTQDRNCSLPSVDLHLADLKIEGRYPIGLGFVKCGGALERAMLYKVLADRIGLPCSLNRSSSTHAWVEVAVPEIDPNDDLEPERKFPAGLLRANYIVELMERPGRLIPRASRQAFKICGPICEPNYASLQRTNICKCRKVASDSVFGDDDLN